MHRVLWLAIAYVGGIAAILGSLMLLGSLLLWLVPNSKITARGQVRSVWQSKLGLVVVSLALSLSGLALLIAFPFPR